MSSLRGRDEAKEMYANVKANCVLRKSCKVCTKPSKIKCQGGSMLVIV